MTKHVAYTLAGILLLLAVLGTGLLVIDHLEREKAEQRERRRIEMRDHPWATDDVPVCAMQEYIAMTGNKEKKIVKVEVFTWWINGGPSRGLKRGK